MAYRVFGKPDLEQLKEIPPEQVDTVETLEEDESENEKADDEEQQTKEDEISDVEKTFQHILTDAVKKTYDFFLQKEISIVAIGDSLTQGVGDSTKSGGYVGILDHTINYERKIVDIVNYGKAGNRTDQMLERLHDPTISRSVTKADIILITIGANDLMKIVKENITNLTYEPFIKEKENYEQRLRNNFNKIIELNPEAHIYLLGFYNPFYQYFEDVKELTAITNEWNEVGMQVSASYPNSTFIPIDDLFVDQHDNLFAQDHFHPNEYGYKKMATRVLEYLTEEKGDEDEI